MTSNPTSAEVTPRQCPGVATSRWHFGISLIFGGGIWSVGRSRDGTRTHARASSTINIYGNILQGGVIGIGYRVILALC